MSVDLSDAIDDLRVVMLRNRSRAVASKQAIMADHTPLSNQNHTTPTSSFLGSPRFFSGLLARYHFDLGNASPTSILESKQYFSNFNNPFGYDKTLLKNPKISPENKQTYEKLDSEGIGLAIIDSIKDEKNEDNFPKPQSKKIVFFRSKLKVQVPSLPSSAFSASESPKSPSDFGIKTRNLHTWSPFLSENSENLSKNSTQAFNGKLSFSEMEQSEDYTCVITHGPNPKTIHIFDNCVVDGCCGVVGSSENSSSQSLNFLSFCHSCKKKLQEGKDIYMYRGEKAFCSNECRSQEMLSEGENNTKLHYDFRT